MRARLRYDTAMRLLLAVIVAMFGPGAAQAQAPGDADVRRLPPAAIAAALLPPPAPPIVRADFVELPAAVAINRVHLIERPHAPAADFCAQRVMSLWVRPIARDLTVGVEAALHRVGDVAEVVTYRHNPAGQSCTDGPTYFHIYATEPETAFADVRRLAALIDQVRAGPDAPLPFPADCRDEFVDLRPCSASAMLAELSTGALRLVATRRGNDLRFGLPLEHRARRGEGRLVELSLPQGVTHYTVRMLVRGNAVRAVHISGDIPIP